MPAKIYQRTTLVMAATAILVLVLDARTALFGAQQGVMLCIHTIIPTLFPYIFLTGMINKILIGKHIPVIRYLGNLCAIPAGGESIFLLGLIGGYPVGAQLIADTYTCGGIDHRTACRMLGFCSNAGPAFIIGMLSPLFTQPSVPFIIWAVHVISAIVVGILLPGKTCMPSALRVTTASGNKPVLERAIITTAKICGWVILFKILLTFLTKWLPAAFPKPIITVLSGILELSNGCVSLSSIGNEGLRMLLCAPLLAFGGVCVHMQTCSVTGSLGLGMYIPGKTLQALISLLLILPCTYILYHMKVLKLSILVLILTVTFATSMIIFANHRKKCSVS